MRHETLFCHNMLGSFVRGLNVNVGLPIFLLQGAIARFGPVAQDMLTSGFLVRTDRRCALRAMLNEEGLVVGRLVKLLELATG